MKTFMTALATAILIAGLVLTPAAASPLSASTCGDTYTVQHLDNMFKIAMKCGLTVADIIYYNPQITNPNVIRSGQVLRLTPTAGGYRHLLQQIRRKDHKELRRHLHREPPGQPVRHEWPRWG